MIDRLLCPSHYNIVQTLRVIDDNAQGIAFIVNPDNQFIGTLTDGDIRRAILSGCALDVTSMELLDPFSETKKKINRHYSSSIYQEKSISAHVDTPLEDLLKLVSQKISIIPLLDDFGHVVNYFEYKARVHTPITSPDLKGNELEYVMQCLKTNWISSQGKFVQDFENQFAAFCRTQYAVAVMNGTAAIHLAVVALGIGPGDEVIVPGLTFAASVNPIIHAGATPVFVDIEKNSWCIDPTYIKRAITSKTKAIIPVHLYGQVCDMATIMKIADKHRLAVIEDAAEAHGAEYDGVRVGSFGRVGCFSFFANKIMTTGEGGMCVTNDKKLYEKMLLLRDHGLNSTKKYWHDVIGYNYRMTNIQAAIGLAQLERIQELIVKRNHIKNIYDTVLKTCHYLDPQPVLPKRKSVTWLVSYILADEKIVREHLIEMAKQKGIEIRPFFYPLNEMAIYKKYRSYPTPICHQIGARGINLPTIIDLSDEAYQKISEKIITIIDS